MLLQRGMLRAAHLVFEEMMFMRRTEYASCFLLANINKVGCKGRAGCGSLVVKAWTDDRQVLSLNPR